MTAATPAPGIVTLRSGTARLEVSPRLGGTIIGYWSEVGGVRTDWLVPRALSPIDGFRSCQLASFPLVPYSNRIRGGHFTFRGRTVAEPVPTGATETMHGHGRRNPWAIVEAHDDRLVIAYEHAPDAWPWHYRARQAFALSASALEVTLAIENRSADAMPAGLGHHPYFPRTPQTTVTAGVAAAWIPEAGQYPTQRVPPLPPMDPNQGVAAERTALDHAFAGWNGRAVIAWPERQARLVMTADAALGTLIIFSPPGRDFVCVEPVSHCVDAFNLAAAGIHDTGMRVLQPGESWETRIVLAPQA